MCFVESGALSVYLRCFTLLRFTLLFTSLSDDVRYDVSTFIGYTFRTFAVIFIVWPSLNVWRQLSTFIDALMYAVFSTCNDMLSNAVFIFLGLGLTMSRN